MVPCTRGFEEHERIPRNVLGAQLAEPKELSGMLNKALDALPRIRGCGLTETPTMREAWQEFRQATDPLSVWLDRATVEGPALQVPKSELLIAYNEACRRDGRPAWAAVVRFLAD